MRRDERWCLLLIFTFLAGLTTNLLADQQSPPGSKKKETPAEPPGSRELAEHLAVTQHSISIDGRTLDYTATAGCLPLENGSGKLQARMFFVAYTVKSASPADRPIAFAFNGGPGAASVFLQVGGIGPKRCPLAKHGTALPGEYRLVDNPWTWLRFTDLVFVDPIGTGYSRAVAGIDATSFYAVDADIQAAAKFVRLYVTRNERWLSPKYLIGESYGTTRAAGLVDRLQKDTGMDFAGLVLISAALDFQTFSFDEDNDLPFVVSVPSYTATARYHRKLSGRLQQDFDKTLNDVRQWALTDYLTALAAGNTLADARREEIAERLVAYTGLPRRVIEENGLRISNRLFAEELLRDENRRLGILDGRVEAAERPGPTTVTNSDPAMYAVVGPWVAVLDDYVRRELKYSTDDPYVFLSDDANRNWRWDCDGRGYVSMSNELAEAMTLNPRLRVYGAAGYYDLTTPYLGQQYTYDHLPIAADLRRNLTFSVYRSGHQIYVSDTPLKRLTDDVESFFGKASTIRCTTPADRGDVAAARENR